MISKEWQITPFLFNYKGTEYIILVKLYQKYETRPKYSIVKLEFIKRNDINESISAYSTLYKINFKDAKTFREFFNISYSKNLVDIFLQFSEQVSSFIPTKVNDNIETELKTIMINSLSQSDAEDPNKIYCFSVKRIGKRSPFNNNKARLLRPKLYEKLKTDKYINFCFADNPLKEKSDEEILYNWIKIDK